MKVIYLDIETRGLDRHSDDITVIAVVSEDTATPKCAPVEHMFNICLMDPRESKAAVCRLLDECDRIVAYNGIGFDIPFMAQWAYAAEGHAVVALAERAWNAKTLDFFQLAETLLGAKVGMQKMCTDNGLAVSKSATGKQAVLWADQEEWEKLENYCMQDVKVLKTLTDFARSNVVEARGYHRSNSMFAPVRYFRLEEDMTSTVFPPTPEHSDYTTLDVWDVLSRVQGG